MISYESRDDSFREGEPPLPVARPRFVDSASVSNRNTLRLIYWSGGVIVLGIALCSPCFSYLPLIWCAGLVMAFITYVAIYALIGRNTSEKAYSIVSLSYTLVFASIIATFSGVERDEFYECDWKMESGEIAIDLRTAGGFGWPHVKSGELAKHLEKDQPVKLQVEVPITRDFGQVRARGMIKTVDGIPVRESW